MSTKIYYGYKLPNIKTVEQLEILRKELINQAKIMKTQIATQLALRSGVFMLDLYKVGFDVPDLKQTVFGYGYQKVNERFREFKKQPYRDPFYDLRFEAIVFLTDPMLAIFIGENKAMRGIFENHKEVEYYGYWNNSDPQEGVTEAEWEQREKDWEFLDGPICNHGIIIAVDDMITFDVHEESFNKTNLQDWDLRCREASKNIVLHKVDKGIIPIPNEMNDINPKDAVGRANVIYQWLEKGDGGKFIDIEMPKVKLCINKTLTYNDIFKVPFGEFVQTNMLE